MTSPTMDTVDLFPSSKFVWGVKLAAPNTDTGYLFPRGKFAWGVKLA
jgi:hypothetical protein